MLDEILTLLSAGAYWPALAAALLLATYAVRKLGADARLARWLRPWIPIGLSAAAFVVAWLTGSAGVAESAAQSLAAAVTAIAGHDTGQALLALARSLLGRPPARAPQLLFRKDAVPTTSDVERYLRRQGWAITEAQRSHTVWEKTIAGNQVEMEVPLHQGTPYYERAIVRIVDNLARFEGRDPEDVRRSILGYPDVVATQRTALARVLSGPLAAVLLPLAPLPALMLAGCITPRSAPLEPRPGFSAKSIDASTAETLAECRRMRDRGILTGAGSAGAGALSAGLGALAIPADRERLQLGLGVGAAVTAAVGAGLALLSTQYGGAVKAHCSPWPAAGGPLVYRPESIAGGPAW